LPRGGHFSLAVDKSIATATDAQLDAEPTLLNFLGEMAKRQGQFNEGIALRRRAINRPDPGSSIALELAKELYQRAHREGRSTGKDVREALALAQKAAVDRRRWSGPSAAAVEVFAQLLQLTNEYRQAIAETTSTAEGGRAMLHEAADPRVIRVGALAALAAHDDDAWTRYLAMLGTDHGEIRTHLEGLRASLDNENSLTPESISVWEQRATEASDDSLAAAAIAHLAHMGVWSARADDLIAREILPASQVQMLKAVVLARTDLEAGVTQLRAMAQTSSMAAVEAIIALGSDPSAALEESRVQFQRWKSWDLAEQQLGLLKQLGNHAAAWDLAFACIRESNFSVGARQRTARWLAKSLTSAGEHNRAAEAAEAGLGLSDEEDELAWLLVAARYNSGNIPRAREAVDRWELTPVTDQEIELWLVLRQGTDLSVSHAQTLLGLLDRLPPGPYRDRVRGLAIRELLTPANEATVYPTHVLEAARELAREAGLDPEALESRNVDAANHTASTDNDSTQSSGARWRRPSPDEFRALLQKARSGLTPLADLATSFDRPYTSALIDNPADVLFAADAGHDLRQAGVKSADHALNADEWVIDLSTIAVLAHPACAGVAAMLPHTPRLLVAGRAVDDIVAARDQLRGIPLAISVANANAGIAIPERADPDRLNRLRVHSQAMESLAATQITIGRDLRSREPLEATIELAASRGIPLWCDDSAARQIARHRRITTFGTADLIDALTPTNRSALLRALASAHIVDLPLEAADVIALARDGQWQPGPAHTALARRGLWRNWEEDWKTPWRAICSAAAVVGMDPLISLSAAALNGALQHVAPSQMSARYAQTAAMALAQAYLHDGGIGSSLYIDALATHVVEVSLIPGPLTFTTALSEELNYHQVADATAVAIELLGQAPTL
jgi:hypothetical protein